MSAPEVGVIGNSETSAEPDLEVGASLGVDVAAMGQDGESREMDSARRGSTVIAVLHPVTSIVSLLALLAGWLLLKPAGSGLMICTFKSTTGIPCPGCGLTRSVTSILHGNLQAAWEYNPFGFGFLVFFAVSGFALLLPRRWKGSLRDLLIPYDRWVFGLFFAFMIAMLAHGLVRGYLVKTGTPSLQWWSEGEIAPSLLMKPLFEVQEHSGEGPLDLDESSQP